MTKTITVPLKTKCTPLTFSSFSCRYGMTRKGFGKRSGCRGRNAHHPTHNLAVHLLPGDNSTLDAGARITGTL